MRNIAIGLVAVCIAVGLWIAGNRWIIPERPEITQSEPFAEREKAYDPAAADCQPEELAKLRSLNNRNAKAQECARRAEEHRNQVDDLKQQTRSAYAAEQNAILAHAQLRASLAEAILIFLALCAAVWAAREAKRAADASEAGNRQDADQSLIELRAYLFPCKIHIQKAREGRPVVNIEMKNSGQTPAYDVTIYPHEFFGPIEKFAFEISETEKKPMGVAGPGEVLTMQGSAPYLIEREALLRSGEWGYAVFGEIHYRDAFKKVRVVEYCAWLPAARGNRTDGGVYDGPLAIAHEHNTERE